MNLVSKPGSANTNPKKRKKERNICVICRLYPNPAVSEITDIRSKTTGQDAAWKPTAACYRRMSLVSCVPCDQLKPPGHGNCGFPIMSNVMVAPRSFCQEARQWTSHFTEFQGVPISPGGQTSTLDYQGWWKRAEHALFFFILSVFFFCCTLLFSQ